MGLNDLLPENRGNKPNKPQREKGKPGRKPKKEPQHTFSVRDDVSTKVLLEKIQKIKELTTPGVKSISQGSIIREALELLAKEMDFPKKEKKYAEFLEYINADSILKK
ncbi:MULTISPECIES: hypothetical protein [Flavobacteriaceae]|uniref:hypothetical protein n=1 Tax=Flavobacteriaceae TaxID=49546 RepID=UPI0014923466|nr:MULTISPECIES: hypothetical protein [Allomuricauda]MDC6367231.1 hypothetical protein [Muricauda sp. AC10]